MPHCIVMRSRSLVRLALSNIVTGAAKTFVAHVWWALTSGDLGDSRGAEKRVSLNSIRRVPYHASAGLPNQVYSKCHEYQLLRNSPSAPCRISSR